MATDSNNQHQHRPGALKQQNKLHKHGKHKSKGQIEREAKGRVNVKIISKKNKQTLKRNDRRHKAQQIRQQKREEILSKKRNRGTQGTPPHFAVVLALHHGLETDKVLDLIKSCDEMSTVSSNEQGICHISIPRFKKRVAFYVPEYGNLHAILDAVKVADSLLCLVSPEGGIDEVGEQCLTCIFGQGLPAIIFAVQGLKSLPSKKQNDSKKLIQKCIERRFPSEKYHMLDTPQDALVIMRYITNHKLKPIYFREYRPHMVAEDIQFEIDGNESEFGVLKMTGYLRGKPLSVNGLVHLPGWGDFQMLQIDAATDPYPLYPKVEKHKRKDSMNQDADMEMEDTDNNVRVLETVNPLKQTSLQSEVLPDPMGGEQTWPTEDELAEAEAQAKKKIVKRVPKGTSEYQAAWIVDSDEEEVGDDDDDDFDTDEDMEADDDDDEVDSGNDNEEEDDEYETLTVTEAGDAAKYDENMDMDEEQKMLMKIKEEKSHVMFPDEIDTPMDKPARIRFQRYRGLKSFRTSPWDPKENLPSDYSRIFQFENFKRTKKKVMSEDKDEEGALPGWYVTVHIANVPKDFMVSYRPGTPVIMFGLLPHEQKLSVLNFAIRRCDTSSQPIKSKERLVFHVGFRRYTSCPVFSQHTNSNKHKYERFLQHDVVTTATIFAPITFPPASVLVFKESHEGCHELIATGSLLSVNPDRIVVKRIVLSGYPFKIHKKSAVVRYMFFNREDIDWFKPVELKTKWGRRGHIKEPLGTHGHMKCVFDGQLKSQDTVLMNLYKRVFPKWTYNSHVPNPPSLTNSQKDEMETEGAAYQMFD